MNPFENGIALVSAERPRVAAWLTEAWGTRARDASPVVDISPFACKFPEDRNYAEMKRQFNAKNNEPSKR